MLQYYIFKSSPQNNNANLDQTMKNDKVIEMKSEYHGVVGVVVI
jgi:hypothetical protein